MSWRERNKTTSERQSHLPIIGPYTGIHATHGTTVRDFWIRTHLAAAWVVQRHQFRRLVKGHLDTQWFVKFKKHCFLRRCVFDLNINEVFVQATFPSMANQIFRQGHFGGKRARLGGGRNARAAGGATQQLVQRRRGDGHKTFVLGREGVVFVVLRVNIGAMAVGTFTWVQIARDGAIVRHLDAHVFVSGTAAQERVAGHVRAQLNAIPDVVQS